METRTEAMKPFFLKAGIPLALSAAGYILARMLSKRGPHFDSSMINVHQDSTDEESFHSFNSNSDTCTECADQQIQDFEVELSLLRGKVDDLRIKGRELETHFLKYMDMKEKESKVIEIGSALSVEKKRAEFLGQEVSLIMEYLKVLKLVEGIKKENRRLCTKVKWKLHVIKELNSKINAMERQLSKNLMELEMKANVIQELNDEISSLKGVVEQLQHEKFEVASNKEVAETSASSELKVEQESVMKDKEYDKLLKELEQIRKERASEEKELIYLRWSNACLRHELQRQHQEKSQKENNSQTKMELEGNGSGTGHEWEENGTHLSHDEACLDESTQCQDCVSKRKKFVQKFKKWVEGGKWEKGKHESKCLRRQFAFDGAMEVFVDPRKSRSSA